MHFSVHMATCISEDSWHSCGQVMWLPVLMNWVCPDRVSNLNLPYASRSLYHEVTVEVSWRLITVQRFFDTIPDFYLHVLQIFPFVKTAVLWWNIFMWQYSYFLLNCSKYRSKAYILQPSTGNSQWRPYTSVIFLNGAQNIIQSIEIYIYPIERICGLWGKN